VVLKYARVSALLGIEIPRDTIKNILLSLGIKIENESSESIELIIPPNKVDVTRDVDVIEEIIRIYGFNQIKINTKLKAVFSGTGYSAYGLAKRKVSDHLTGNGFFEILTNSLLNSKYQEKLTGEVSPLAIPILNPISSELDILRNDFIYSGLEVVAHNLNHKSPSVNIFEFGKTYQYNKAEVKSFRDHYTEQSVLGIWVCGESHKENWYQEESPADFYRIKGVVETVLTLLNVPHPSPEKTDHTFYKTTYCITSHKKTSDPLVVFGEVNPALLKIIDIKQPVYYAEFNWDAILKQLPAGHTAFTQLPKYPSVRRDLALVLDKSVEYRLLKETSFKTEKHLLQEVNIFDVYEGKGIPEGKKSYALSFVFRDKNKTLTDGDIDKCMQKLIDQFKSEFKAEIRS
jgi:phenylalanyl-tRNA synthetase beta chain